MNRNLSYGGKGRSGYSSGGGGGIGGNVNPTFLPFAQAINVLSDTNNVFDPVNFNTGFGIVPSVTNRVHIAQLAPAANAIGFPLRIECLAPLIPSAGFGQGIEFMGKALISGLPLLYGSIETYSRAASPAQGVAAMDFRALDAAGTNRLMLSLLPSTLSPNDNRAILYAKTTIEMNGGGAGPANMSFTLDRTDTPSANIWGIDVPFVLRDGAGVLRNAGRISTEWESYTAAHSQIKISGMKLTTAIPFLAMFSEKAGLYTASPAGIFDIFDESGLKVLPHVLFSSTAFTHGITSLLPVNSWGGILCGSAGSSYSNGGVIFRGISLTGIIAPMQLDALYSGAPVFNSGAFIMRVGRIDGGSGITSLVGTMSAIRLLNFTNTLIDVLCTGHVGINALAQTGSLLFLQENINASVPVLIRNDTDGASASSGFQAQVGTNWACTMRMGNSSYNDGGMLQGRNGFLFTASAELNVLAYNNFALHFGTNNTRRITINGSGEFQHLDSSTYFGLSGVDGSWRIRVVGTNILFERREAGVYVTKGTFTA